MDDDIVGWAVVAVGCAECNEDIVGDVTIYDTYEQAEAALLAGGAVPRGRLREREWGGVYVHEVAGEDAVVPVRRG